MVKKSEIKSFNVRLPREIWIFLKRVSAEQERSMADVVAECVDKYKRKLENKLTDHDTNV
jgi:predicted DNA-binding protein